MPHHAQLAPDVLLKQCDETRTRRSGPGGQNRNKVETAVVLTHRPTNIVAEANERRSQAENRNVAVFRLRLTLAVECRSEEVASEPTELWRGRVQGDRIRVNPEHADYPGLLAEALDVITRHDFDLKPAAEFLGVTSSQLTKFLKLEPRAFGLVNRERQARGLHSLS